MFLKLIDFSIFLKIGSFLAIFSTEANLTGSLTKGVYSEISFVLNDDYQYVYEKQIFTAP